MKKVLIFCFSVLLANSNETQLLETVKNDPVLQSGAHIVNLDNKSFLVAVGKAEISGTDAQAKIRAIKESKIKAQKSILVFVHGSNISYDESRQKRTITTERSALGEVQSQRTTSTVKYERIIQEISDGILTGLKPLSSWHKENSYFSAFFFPLSD